MSVQPSQDISVELDLAALAEYFAKPRAHTNSAERRKTDAPKRLSPQEIGKRNTQKQSLAELFETFLLPCLFPETAKPVLKTHDFRRGKTLKIAPLLTVHHPEAFNAGIVWSLYRDSETDQIVALDLIPLRREVTEFPNHVIVTDPFAPGNVNGFAAITDALYRVPLTEAFIFEDQQNVYNVNPVLLSRIETQQRLHRMEGREIRIFGEREIKPHWVLDEPETPIPDLDDFLAHHDFSKRKEKLTPVFDETIIPGDVVLRSTNRKDGARQPCMVWGLRRDDNTGEVAALELASIFSFSERRPGRKLFPNDLDLRNYKLAQKTGIADPFLNLGRIDIVPNTADFFPEPCVIAHFPDAVELSLPKREHALLNFLQRGDTFPVQMTKSWQRVAGPVFALGREELATSRPAPDLAPLR